jgi:mRNA interferase MazF
MVEYLWGIFWVDLDPTQGSEQSGVRPALVISVEEVNQALPIVTVMSMTSMKPGRRIYPTEVLLASGETGLSKDSIAMAHQIRAISKERLKEKCGAITSEDVKEKVRNALRLYLDL